MKKPIINCLFVGLILNLLCAPSVYAVLVSPDETTNRDLDTSAIGTAIVIAGIVVGAVGITIDLIDILGLDSGDVPENLQLTVNGDRMGMHFLLQGGELLDDVTLDLSGSMRGPLGGSSGVDFWVWSLKLQVDEDWNQEIKVQGNVRHAIEGTTKDCEGEGPSNIAIPFRMNVYAEEHAVGTNRQVNNEPLPVVEAHGNHQDILTHAHVNFDIIEDFFYSNEIPSWRVEFRVHHTPEPSTALLLGFSSLALLHTRRKKC
ncbi:MAG: PEP-CTERM sorting domain-containing protein [Phycisphaerae bacterium]|jgi:hypothetical protein